MKTDQRKPYQGSQEFYRADEWIEHEAQQWEDPDEWRRIVRAVALVMVFLAAGLNFAVLGWALYTLSY